MLSADATSITVYRAALWDTPWWANSPRRAGRWNRPAGEPVQYWASHPLTPAAETLRSLGPEIVYDLDTVRYRLWAARIPAEGLVRVTFATATDVGLRPEELVGEDYGPTQDLADRVRAQGAAGLIAPSAALAGTQTVALFGARLLFPYLVRPIDPEQVATAHAAEGTVPAEVVGHVRWGGEAHAGLVHWQATGDEYVLRDPPVGRPAP